MFNGSTFKQPGISAAALLLAGMGIAQAQTQTFELNDVSLGFGGTVSGNFTANIGADTFTSWDLVVSNDGHLSGYTFTPSDSVAGLVSDGIEFLNPTQALLGLEPLGPDVPGHTFPLIGIYETPKGGDLLEGSITIGTPTVKAPEIDASAAGTGVTLLVGGLLLMGGSRRKLPFARADGPRC